MNQHTASPDSRPLNRLLVITVLSLGLYLILPTFFANLGFPLDDALIHES